MPIRDYIRFLTKYRNIPNLIFRGTRIWERHGLSVNKMRGHLNTYLEVLGNHGVVPTFPIPAILITRHPEFIRRFNGAHIDFAIHGYTHQDFAALSFGRQKRQIEMSSKVLKEASVPFSGFRCPYLKWNKYTLNAIEEHHFLWDSSHTILWDTVEREIPQEKLPVYQKHLELYDFRKASEYVSVPRFHNTLVEIPVSLPDDDILTDRLDIVDSTRIDRIWRKILSNTYEKGDLFVLQLHPERINLCKVPLESLLVASEAYRRPIWIASLSEISIWWREKNRFYFNILKNTGSKYSLEAQCSDRATLLAKNVTLECESKEFFNRYQLIQGKRFTLRAPIRPAIGVSRHAPNLIEFLKNEGFFFEISDKKQRYGIYFDSDTYIQKNERKFLRLIEESQSPIIRFWRWPDAAQSALAITGDIEALTSIDFFLRLFEH